MGSIVLVATINPGEGGWVREHEQFTSKLILLVRHRRIVEIRRLSFSLPKIRD